MSARLGNVLHQLRAYAHPHIKHAITQTLDQTTAENEAGNSDPQKIHILGQAIRIQRGELLDEVTALLPPAQ